MILLDTHVWIWWINGDTRLPFPCVSHLDKLPIGEAAVSVFSCWEVAMLHSRERLDLGRPLDEWLALALDRAKVRALELSHQIAVDSCRLPGKFHGDPADRIIVATARSHACPLVTADAKILAYPHPSSHFPASQMTSGGRPLALS